MDKDCYINANDKKIQYKLVRSRRKTIGITISKEGDVKVSAPLKTTEKQIVDIVNNKAPWILKKLEEIRNSYGVSAKNRLFQSGEIFLYRGLEYTLNIHKKHGIRKPEIGLQSEGINIVLPDNAVVDDEGAFIKSLLRSWYIGQFEIIIRERIPKYASLVGVNPSKVTIREQKTRWGSCSAKGNINLNWKLIMAPPEVLDYVIVHELCHMRQMNHSKKFWDIVGNTLPEFSKSKKWLKANSARLVL